MKRIAIRGLILLLIASVVVVSAYLDILFLRPALPDGMYASFDFIGHDRADVLDFKSGVVTWRTCCGDEDFGTYRREPDGTWVWTFQLLGS